MSMCFNRSPQTRALMWCGVQSFRAPYVNEQVYDVLLQHVALATYVPFSQLYTLILSSSAVVANRSPFGENAIALIRFLLGKEKEEKKYESTHKINLFTNGSKGYVSRERVARVHVRFSTSTHSSKKCLPNLQTLHFSVDHIIKITNTWQKYNSHITCTLPPCKERESARERRCARGCCKRTCFR